MKQGSIQIFLIVLLIVGLVAATYSLSHLTSFTSQASTNLSSDEETKQIRDDIKKHLEKLGGEGEEFVPSPGATNNLTNKLTSPSVGSCGEITSPGNYTLSQSITSEEGTCINVHDVQNVFLDCQNNTITANNTGTAVVLDNVQNFSLVNCKIRTGPDYYFYLLTIHNSSTGKVANSSFIGPLSGNTMSVSIENSNGIEFANNSLVNVSLQHYKSSFGKIHDNTIALSTAPTSGAVTWLIDGHNNTFQNNTLDGKWDGVHHATYQEYLGGDDGLVVLNEYADMIIGNTISNNWDCGIETWGLIKETKFINNKIDHTGLCGIGGWYFNSWLQNETRGNRVTRAPYLFYFFRALGFNEGETTVYFKDNAFIKNVFSKQSLESLFGPTRKFSSLIDFQNTPSDIPQSALKLKNNTFKNNDFNHNIFGPVLIPKNMIIDQGGNKCKPRVNQTNPSLKCNY